MILRIWIVWIGTTAMMLPSFAFAFSPDLNSRVTSAQDSWRESGAAFWGDSVPLSPSSAQTLQGKVQLILDRLVYVSPLRGYDIRAQILPDTSVNAHTEGKAVSVNMGLVKAVGGREDMLAAVMAHELGHILANHQVQPPASETKRLIQTGLPFLNLNRYTAMASAALTSGVQLQDASYGRHQEEEADAIGTFLMVSAGYNPYSLSEFVETASSKTSGFLPAVVSLPSNFSNVRQVAASVGYSALASSPLMKSHPPSPVRKNIIQLMAQRTSGQMNDAQLAQSSSWMAEVYDVMERRSPKEHEK